MFPYHYGSYATVANDKGKVVGVGSFHTTMVLTQLSLKALVITTLPAVSIPLWFLRNKGHVGL